MPCGQLQQRPRWQTLALGRRIGPLLQTGAWLCFEMMVVNDVHDEYVYKFVQIDYYWWVHWHDEPLD